MILASEVAEHGNVLLENAIFFVVGLAVFTLLGLFTFSFRDVANRHSQKAEAYAKRQGHDAHH